MNKTLRKISYVGMIAALFFMSGCKKKDPSVLKVFVRSSNNELVSGAKVVIIADVSSDPPTPAYTDTVLTNSSGFAYFEMDEFFEPLPKKEKTGYFDILAKRETSQGEGYVRCRAYITSVKTVYLEP